MLIALVEIVVHEVGLIGLGIEERNVTRRSDHVFIEDLLLQHDTLETKTPQVDVFVWLPPVCARLPARLARVQNNLLRLRLRTAAVTHAQRIRVHLSRLKRGTTQATDNTFWRCPRSWSENEL